MIVLEVYGEMEYIEFALKFIANIFSTSDYKSLTTTFMIFGFTCAFCLYTFSDKNSKSLVTLFLYSFCSISLFTVMTVPKTKVTVHDLVTNQFTVINSVPYGLTILISTFLNMENGLNQLVIDSASPISDPTMVGRGESIELLNELKNLDTYVEQYDKTLVYSLREYMRDCALLEVSLGSFNLESLHRTNNLWESLKSNKQGILTKSHYLTGPVTNPTCKQAYADLTNRLNIAVGEITKSLCEAKNYEEAQCRNTYDIGVLSLLSKSPVKKQYITLHNMIINSTVADAFLFSQAMLTDGAAQQFAVTQADMKTIGGNYAATMAATKWVPILMGMYRGMLIIVFPLLMLLVWLKPKQTIQFYLAGFFVLLIWSVIDTALLCAQMRKMQALYEQATKSGLGIQQLISLPSISLQTMTQYGSSRFTGMAFSIAIVSSILGITAMRGIMSGVGAGTIASNSQHSGQQYSGVEGEVEAFNMGAKTMAAKTEQDYIPNQAERAYRTGFHDYIKSQSDIDSTHNLSELYGKARTLENMTQFKTNDMMYNIGKSNAVSKEQAFALGETNTGQALAGLHKLNKLAEYSGQSTFDVQKNLELNKGQFVANKEFASHLEGAKAGDVMDIKLDNEGNILMASGTRRENGLTTTSEYGKDRKHIKSTMEGLVTDDNLEYLKNKVSDKHAAALTSGYSISGIVGDDGKYKSYDVKQGGAMVDLDKIVQDNQNEYKDGMLYVGGLKFDIHEMQQGSGKYVSRLHDAHQKLLADPTKANEKELIKEARAFGLAMTKATDINYSLTEHEDVSINVGSGIGAKGSVGLMVAGTGVVATANADAGVSSVDSTHSTTNSKYRNNMVYILDALNSGKSKEELTEHIDKKITADLIADNQFWNNKNAYDKAEKKLKDQNGK